MKYSILNETVEDMHPIHIDEGEFKGCELTYGKLSFDNKVEGMLHFDYNITNGFIVEPDRMEAFVNTIGDLLVQLIEESVQNNEVVYTGGIDDEANRGSDSGEPA